MPVINPGECNYNVAYQFLDVNFTDSVLGSGNRLGKKPKASPFDAPGRSLHQSTNDVEKNSDSNSAPTFQAATRPIESKTTATQKPTIAPEVSAGKDRANRTSAQIASDKTTPTPKTTGGIRIHEITSPGSKASKEVLSSNAAATSKRASPIPGHRESAKPMIQASIATSTPVKRKENGITSAQVNTPDRVLPVLPQGWRAWPHAGTFFYENFVTGKTQWELPTEPASSSAVAPTWNPGTAMPRPVHTSPVPVGGIHQTGVQSHSGILQGNIQAQPMSTATHSYSAISPNTQLINRGSRTLVPMAAQPLQLHPAMTLLERGDAIDQHQQDSTPKHPREFIDTSKREEPINPLLHGIRIYFIRPCSPGCLQSISPLNITFPHSHPIEEGHFIKGETWWLNTNKQVTVHQHPLSETEVAELSDLEIASYIEALEDCAGRRLVLQDDNDLGWFERGWITRVGIWGFDMRRRQSLLNLKDEFVRRVSRKSGRAVDWFDASLVADGLVDASRSDVAQPRLPTAASASTTVLPFRANLVGEGVESRRGRPAIMAPSIDLSDYILDEDDDLDEVPAAEVAALVGSGTMDEYGRPISPPRRLLP